MHNEKYKHELRGDKVTVQKIDTYIASNDSALATVRQSAQVAVDQSSANAGSN